MAVDKKFKLGLPRLFCFPFLSCQNCDAAALVQEPVVVSRQSELGELLPRQPSSRPLRPSCPSKLTLALPALFSPMSSPKQEGAVVRCGRRAGRAVRAEACRPAAPASPLPSCIKSMELVEEKVVKNIWKKKETLKRKKKHASASNTSSGNSHCFFSTDDEDHDDQLKGADKEADHDLFTSKSFSSDSSLESCRLKLPMRRRAKPRKVGRSFGRDHEPGLLAGDQKEQSVAVVKRSSDPYADFRISMVEMIIEKQIFGAQELEKLLDCFLALNAPYHHRAIVEVFEEICEALFSNWS